jgi:hypothetical protein
MPKLTVKKQTVENADEAYKKVKLWLSDDKNLSKLDPGYNCQFNDGSLTGKATGKMFKADMSVKAQGTGSEVEIVVDLPLTLALAKGMIEKTIQKKLDETLG